MSRYETIGRRLVEDKNVKQTSIYPEVASSEEDYYIITSMGDRYDILSNQFYGTVEYWWIIASNNPHARRDTLFLEPGLQIRIPPYRKAKEQYESLNASR
jgi:hypothetical protein